VEKWLFFVLKNYEGIRQIFVITEMKNGHNLCKIQHTALKIGGMIDFSVAECNLPIIFFHVASTPNYN
jgi:hypothetical protein